MPKGKSILEDVDFFKTMLRVGEEDDCTNYTEDELKLGVATQTDDTIKALKNTTKA